MAIVLSIGGTFDLGVEGALDSEFEYASNDPSKVTIDAMGIVTAVAPGTTSVVITRKSDNIKEKVLITVKKPEVSRFTLTVDGRRYGVAAPSVVIPTPDPDPEPEPQLVFSNLTMIYEDWMPQITYQWGTNQSVSGPWDLRLAAAYMEDVYEGQVYNVTTPADTIHTHYETMTIPFGEYYVEVKLSSSDTWTRGTDVLMIQPQGGM